MPFLFKASKNSPPCKFSTPGHRVEWQQPVRHIRGESLRLPQHTVIPKGHTLPYQKDSHYAAQTWALSRLRSHQSHLPQILTSLLQLLPSQWTTRTVRTLLPGIKLHQRTIKDRLEDDERTRERSILRSVQSHQTRLPTQVWMRREVGTQRISPQMGSV